jgi:hypothetical protein
MGSTIFIICLLVLISSGCGTGKIGVKKPLREAEILLGTNSEKLDYFYHPVLEDIRGLGLQFPGFLIGIEKTDRTKIGFISQKKIKALGLDAVFDESGLQSMSGRDKENHRIYKILNDGKRTFVSHIIEYTLDNQAALPRIKAENPIFNAYTDSDVINQTATPKTLNVNTISGRRIFDVSRKSITSKLYEQLSNRIQNPQNNKPYTHILVYSMGWNTGQKESIENFNSLVGYLLDSVNNNSDVDFNPLFIGLTWPSTWSFGSGNISRLKRALSVLNKGNDADEIGLTWANFLINESLQKIKSQNNLKIVALGHSYGSRLISRALFSCEVLKNHVCSSSTVDLFIGLQSAFSKSRYSQLTDADSSKEYLWLTKIAEKLWFNQEGKPYTSYPNTSVGAKQVLLWSEYDTATSLLNFAGGNNLISLSGRAPHNSIFEHRKINNFGGFSTIGTNSNKVLLLDASAIVFNELPIHGGDAHSDIYKKEIGDVVYQLIQKFAP